MSYSAKELEARPWTDSGSYDDGEYIITWSTQNNVTKYSAWIFDPSKRWHRRHLATTENFQIAAIVCEAHEKRAA